VSKNHGANSPIDPSCKANLFLISNNFMALQKKESLAWISQNKYKVLDFVKEKEL